MTRSQATLTDLVAAVRKAVDVRTGWPDTADLVADQLRAARLMQQQRERQRA